MDSQISFKTKAINFHSFEQYGFYTKKLQNLCENYLFALGSKFCRSNYYFFLRNSLLKEQQLNMGILNDGQKYHLLVVIVR